MTLDHEPSTRTAASERTLRRNLKSLRQHRPALFAMLRGVDSIADPLTPIACEEERVTTAFATVADARKAGHAIAICGIGDGSIVRAFARFAPTLLLHREQEVNVIEPDLGRLVGVLSSIDFTGPRGPIEQLRFDWHVGEAWEDSLCDALFAQPTKMLPKHIIPGGDAREEIDAGFWRVADRLHARHVEQGREISDHYAAKDDAELLAVMSNAPPRKPRVLLITSQFTAVLQYSTNDSADAFRQLGWETRVITEAEPWHLMARPAIRAAIAGFKPDLVFQIDHLRYELGKEIPAKLPFVCWIQDHLVNLTSTEAGETIGERDFVLTGGTYRYVGRFAYPRRQCVDMPKVARAPVLPTHWEHDREDLFYVSHWSMLPEQIVVETCARVRELSDAGSEAVMRESMGELTRVYADGGAMRTELEIRGIVRGVAKRLGEELEPVTERQFVDILFQRLNNALYRQQSLLWAGQIADELGLRFGIYGMGWEKHPQLGRFARGVVTYGPDLEALTRQSKILLQLEPYGCYTHQRMLDCVLAGGFALIRDHPLNTLPIRIRKFLDQHVPPEVNDVATTRSLLRGEVLQEFDAILNDAQIISDVGDPVDVVRGWQRARTIGDGDETLPHLNSINFDSFETLRDRVKTFVNESAKRAKISADQRESILERLTYVSAIGQANKRIYELLRESIESPATLTTRAAEAA